MSRKVRMGASTNLWRSCPESTLLNFTSNCVSVESSVLMHSYVNRCPIGLTP